MMRFSTLLLAACFPLAFLNPISAMITVELGNTQVDLAASSGITTTALDIIFSNTTTSDLTVAGYSLFVDIGTSGKSLPQGVSFADPAVTYRSGLGEPPLPLAGPGTMNLNPAAGDIGLGQLQFSDASIGAGESFVMLSLNLEIDLALASPGVFDVLLSPQGENSLSTISGPQTFSVTTGTLTLTTMPSLLGDFDLDMDVDGVDFLHWQRGDSLVPISATDLTDWQNSFGISHSDNTILSPRIIPEPGSFALLAITLPGIIACRNRH